MTRAGEPARGRFIVLEGIDGSGSTTQANLLVERLRRSGRPALGTCEPSQGPVGTLIRQALGHRLEDAGGAPLALDWVSLALLFAADRSDHVHRCIEPALRVGQFVVSDRYDLSSLAYQSATSGEGIEVLTWIRQLNQRAPRPDLTIVVDVSALTAERRRLQRGEAAELFEVPELQQRLAAVYRDAKSLVPGDRLLHVDGEAGVAAVAEAIWSAVQAL